MNDGDGLRAHGVVGGRWFLGYLGLRAVSAAGDNLWAVALGYAAATLGDPALVGLVFAMGAVPRLVLTLMAGVAVDRIGARRVMVLSDLAAAVLFASAAVLWWDGRVGGTALVVTALLFGAVDAFYEPATGAFVPQLVTADERAQAEGLLQSTATGAGLAGAAVAGVVFAAGGVALAAALDAATFAVICAGTLLLRPRYRQVLERESSTMWRDARAGLSVVWATPVLRQAAWLALGVNTAALPMVQVSLPLRAQASGWGSQGYAIAEVVFLAGAVVGGVAAVRVGGWHGGHRSMLAAVLVASVFLLPVTWSSALWLTACCLLVAAGGMVVAGALIMARVQGAAPPQMLGRVMAVLVVVSAGGTPAGAACFGFLVEWLGLTEAGLLFALALLLVVVGIALRRPPAGNEMDPAAMAVTR